MATRRTFADLSSYRQALDQPQVNPLEAALQGLQQGVQLEQLPQTIQQNALENQLKSLLQQAKLQELQRGKIFEVGNNLVRQNPDGTFESMFSAPVTSTGAQESFQFTGLDAAGNPVQFGNRGSGLIPAPVSQGLQFTGQLQPKIKPTETQQFAGFDASNNPVQFGNRGSGLTTAPAQAGIDTSGPLQPKTQAVKSKSILATNEKTGRVANIVLNPGEELPEGFKQQTKTADDFKNIQSLRKEVSDNPVIKQFASIQQYKQRIDDAIEEAKTTNNFVGVDQTLISAFNRLNEPDSVTMVSEYARTSADAPIINRIKANINRITEGGRLSQEERDALSRLSNRIYQTSLGNYSKTSDWFEGIAEQNGWDAGEIIQPLVFGQASPRTTNPSTSSGVDSFRKKHGLNSK